MSAFDIYTLTGAIRLSSVVPAMSDDYIHPEDFEEWYDTRTPYDYGIRVNEEEE